MSGELYANSSWVLSLSLYYCLGVVSKKGDQLEGEVRGGIPDFSWAIQLAGTGGEGGDGVRFCKNRQIQSCVNVWKEVVTPLFKSIYLLYESFSGYCGPLYS